MSGHHRAASEVPFIHDVSLAGRWLPVLVAICVRASLVQ